jgi:hypothetical protein
VKFLLLLLAVAGATGARQRVRRPVLDTAGSVL